MGISVRSVFVSPFVLGVAVLFSGCSEKSVREPGVYVEKKSVAWEQLADSDVMVAVNGVGLTKRDFNSLASLRCQLVALQQNRVHGGFPNKDVLGEMAAGLVMELIHHELFRQYAEKRAIRPSAEQVAEATRNLMTALKRPREASFESVVELVSGDARELFRRIPYVDAQDQLLRQSVTTNDLDSVTDEEIAARERFVAEFDANADRLNAKQRRKLVAARKEIMAGADFAAVAAKCSEVSPEHGKEWETVELGELPPDEDLAVWLKKAKVGEVSKPLDLPDGLGLVKLVSVGKGEAPKGAPLPDVYTLVKCTVRAFERMQYQDRPTMRNQLLMWKRQEAQKKLGTMLYDQAVIEYPNGTDFFPEFDRIYNEAQGGKQ